jgi:tRNA uridine 5-carbamoylmethylation protein Kti12
MRMALARIAARASMSFVEIFVPATAQMAAEVNATRPHGRRVPDGVIAAMAEALEVPDPAAFYWEANAIETPPIWARRVPDDDRLLWERIAEAMRRGPLMLFATEQQSPNAREERERSRKANAESTVHQIDLWSRRIVSEVIRAAAPEERPAIAARLAAIRKQLLRLVASDEDEGDLDNLKQEFLMALAT